MGEHLLLVHDVQDAQLVDRREQRIGRIDELLLSLPDSGPPTAEAMLIGATPRAKRAGAWAVALRRVLFAITRRTHDPVSRVPFGAVSRIGDTVQLDIDGDSLESSHLEVWLREQIVHRIPGGGGDVK